MIQELKETKFLLEATRKAGRLLEWLRENLLRSL